MISEYLHLLQDPAHLAFEFTMIVVVDGLLLGLAVPFIRRAIRNHDKEHHQ